MKKNQWLNQMRKNKRGLSLVELLIALALLAFVSFSFLSILSKIKLTNNTIDGRYSAVAEIEMVIRKIQDELNNGAYISNNSHQHRLEYTIANQSGNAEKRVYKIVAESGKYYLQYSIDNATTYISPYPIANYNKYVLTGSPQFLYAEQMNNCTVFTDTNANGYWQSGTDAAGVYDSSCPNASGFALSMPSEASKVILKGFEFSTETGLPQIKRALLSYHFIRVNPGLVRFFTSPADGGEKDVVLVNAFDAGTSDSLYGSAFSPIGIAWDNTMQRLVISGEEASQHQIFLSNADGVIINQPYVSTIDLDGDDFAVFNKGKNVIELDADTNTVYWFSLTEGFNALAVKSSIDLSGTITSPSGIAYDRNVTDSIYVVGGDPGDSDNVKLFQVNRATGAITSTIADLSADLSYPANPPSRLTIDPVLSNDFLVVLNNVTGSTPNRLLTLYRYIRSSGITESFTINTDDIGSSESGIAGLWGIAYNPDNNHLFLSSHSDAKIFEIVPDRIISTQ
ncbi:MAG: prepilin-type N-terminal cleavage/methylation domain-containing protein [Cyanobacteria bacterium P01_H01_bin.74]